MRAAFYSPPPARCIRCFANRRTRPGVQSCSRLDRFDISLAFTEGRRVAWEAVIIRHLWKNHLFCRLCLKQTFLGSLTGQRSHSCCWAAEGTAAAARLRGMRLHQTTEIAAISHPFRRGCSCAGAPCRGLLRGQPAEQPGQHCRAVRRRETRGAGDAPGSGSRLPSGGFRRGRLWEMQARPLCMGECVSQPLEPNTAFCWSSKCRKGL